MEKAIKAAFNRHSDQKYYLTKLLSARYLIENPNPEFTDEDNKFKLEIFDIPDLDTCFITYTPCKGVGDHIYEINNYFKKTGRRGIDDPWNTVPVCGKLNKGYKKFKFKMNGKKIEKDIGYEELTIGELNFLISSSIEYYNEMASIYCKMNDWKMYVEKRGAKMYYEESDELKKLRDTFKINYDKFWSEIINQIMLLNNQ